MLLGVTSESEEDFPVHTKPNIAAKFGRKKTLREKIT
jgi:hypothetical protein